jgi:hypothetical protein
MPSLEKIPPKTRFTSYLVIFQSIKLIGCTSYFGDIYQRLFKAVKAVAH